MSTVSFSERMGAGCFSTNPLVRVSQMLHAYRSCHDRSIVEGIYPMFFPRLVSVNADGSAKVIPWKQAGWHRSVNARRQIPEADHGGLIPDRCDRTSPDPLFPDSARPFRNEYTQNNPRF